jgi:hypothetical protein
MHKTEQHSREGVLVERAQRAAVAADSGSQVLRHLGVHLDLLPSVLYFYNSQEKGGEEEVSEIDDRAGDLKK